MTPSLPDVQGIVARAAFLSERLAEPASGARVGPIDEQRVKARLARLCEVTGRGDPDLLRRRLSWDGLDAEAVRRALGGEGGSRAPLPPWAGTLSQVIEAASGPAAASVAGLPLDACLRAEEPLPFEDLLVPCLQVGRARLLARLASSTSPLSPSAPDRLPPAPLSERAYLSLERSLLRRLALSAAPALAHEFSKTAPARQQLLAVFGGEPAGPSGTARYLAFVRRWREAGLGALFDRYPVLGRLLAASIDRWAEASAELLLRLVSDLPLLQATFDLGGTRTLHVESIETDLSDLARGGRTVSALALSCGRKLVYKPKPAGMEAAYGRLVAWCNDEGAPLRLRAPLVLDRGAYGWAEHVSEMPCPDEGAVERFYRGAGALLCVMYVLGGVDAHAGNLVVSGEHLVLVDMETLLYPELSRVSEEEEEQRPARDSVLRTGLLPFVGERPPSTNSPDMSGLGLAGAPPIRRRRWRLVNTDDMHLGWETVPDPRSIPVSNGAAARPQDHVEELIDGLRRTYRFLSARRTALLAPGGPLSALREQKVRFVLRNSGAYAAVLEQALSPERLRDGADFGVELERLAHAFVRYRERPRTWPLLRAEIEALERLDVPCFEAAAGSDALPLGPGSRVPACFRASPHDELLRRVERLDEADLARQIEHLRASARQGAAGAPPDECPTRAPSP